MQETDSIKALELQAKNTKYLMDKLNRATYGLAFDEVIRLMAIHREDAAADKLLTGIRTEHKGGDNI